MKPLNIREVQKIEPNEGKEILDIIHTSNWAHKPTEVKKHQPLRTAAYCRVSTLKEDQAGSLKQQIAFYTYFIMKEPKYEFAGIYVDEGISGQSMKNRTGLQSLIKACESQDVSLIICKSISRFSRNIVDVLEISRYLAALPNPVYIYFEREGIYTNSKEGDLMLSIFGGIAQEESINLGNIIAWGLRSQAKRGIIRRGKPNYGYRTDEQYRWHIVAEEATVVRRIYEDVRKGKRTHSIAVALSEEQVPTPEKKLNWNTTTIDRIVTSVTYRGDYLFQQYVNENGAEKKTVRNVGQEPQYYIERHHEPIIDPETWEEVQLILEMNLREYAKRNEPVDDIGEKRNPSFERKMYCGKCGTFMIRKRNRRKYNTEVYHSHYWACRKKGIPHEYINSSCSSKLMQQRYFEEHFAHVLEQLISQIATFEKQAMKWIANVDLSEQERIEEHTIQQDITALNQVLYDTVNVELQEQGLDSRRVDQITERLSNLYGRQKTFQERKEQAIEDRRNLKQLIKRLKQYEKEPDDAFPADLYEFLITKAVVYEDGRVNYHCRFGVEWTTDKRYAPYIQMRRRECKDRTKQRHVDIRNSSEVAELLEYCKEPRIWREIMAYINERMFISSPHLENVVIKSLLTEGKMERFKAPHPANTKDVYYYRFIES